MKTNKNRSKLISAITKLLFAVAAVIEAIAKLIDSIGNKKPRWGFGPASYIYSTSYLRKNQNEKFHFIFRHGGIVHRI